MMGVRPPCIVLSQHRPLLSATDAGLTALLVLDLAFPKAESTQHGRARTLCNDDEHTLHGELERFVPTATKQDSEELGDRRAFGSVDVSKEEAKGDEVGDIIEHGPDHYPGRWVDAECSSASCLLVLFS